MSVTNKAKPLLRAGACYLGFFSASYGAGGIILAYLYVNPSFGITLADVVPHRAPGGSLIFTTRQFAGILVVLFALCCLPLTWWYLRRLHSVKRLWLFTVTLYVLFYLLGKGIQAIRYQLYEWNVLHTTCCAFLFPLFGLITYLGAYLIVYQRGFRWITQRVTT